MKGNHIRYIIKNALTVGLMLAFQINLGAQSKASERANELFKYNQFAEAAELYQQELDELEAGGKSGRGILNLKAKLAYCHRMNNKMDLAEKLYAEVVQDEKARADTYFYYAEALMSNGKYEEAKKWFSDYLVLEPEDDKAKLMIESCNRIPTLQPYFRRLDIREFSHNSPADDNAPLRWQDGILFSSDRQTGVKLLKEKSGWTGRDFLDLYFSEKLTDSSFAEPRKFSSRLSEVNKNTGNASVTEDGSEIYFTRNDNVLNKQDAYSLQLFRATSTGSDRWKSVDKLSFCSPNYNYMHPAISPDGQTLFFVTNKAGGEGGTDIWVAQRKGDDWERPENLGPTVNTPSNEGFPFYDAQGRLYFCSKGHPGYGGFDIFVTEQDTSGNWTVPRNLGKPINSSLDDISIYIAPDQHSGMFTSSRNGGDDDIFLFTVLDLLPSTAPLTLTPQPEDTSGIEIKVEEKGGGQKAEEPVLFTDFEDALIYETVPAPVSGKGAAKESTDSIPASPEEKKKTEQEATDPIPASPEEKKETEQPSRSGDLPSFSQFIQKLEDNNLTAGERFRLDNAVFDQGIWQLTPKISVMLDKLVELMRQYPVLKIELSSHTDASGSAEENLKLSQNRVQLALEYMLREGIAKDRVITKSCGDADLLNHCKRGAACSENEHLFNQRFEIKVLAIGEKE